MLERRGRRSWSRSARQGGQQVVWTLETGLVQDTVRHDSQKTLQPVRTREDGQPAHAREDLLISKTATAQQTPMVDLLADPR